ncbi:MAG: ATP-binding cassette domain-containing protein [Candidatus Binatia bacterium]
MSPNDRKHIALRVDGLWFAYHRADWVLKNLCLSVPQGKMTMLMGPSGTGKTTLLKLLAGILTPSRGHIEVLDHPITNQSQRALSSLIGYIPQQLGLVRNLTALENVLMGALGRCGSGALFGLFPKSEIERARAAIELMGIADKTDEKVFRLSGGQRQRVAIARTLLQHPRVVVADEFVSDLDMALASEVLSRIRRAAEQEKITFVMSMHRQGIVREFADHVVTLKAGEIETGFPLIVSQEPVYSELVQ